MKIVSCIILFLLVGNCNFLDAQTDAEKDLCFRSFGYAYEAATLGTEAVSLAAEAVWGASELNGSTATFTGTLTQSTADPNVWSYSSTPNDKLVVVYSNGTRIEFKFTTFQGYTSGTWEDFTDSHQLDFTVSISGQIDLRIQSLSVPESDTTKWSRTITGTVAWNGQSMTTNLSHSGRKHFEIGSSIALYWYWEQYTGTANSPSVALNISQGSFTYIGHNSNLGEHVRNDEMWNNGSATLSGATYQFQNAHTAFASGSVLGDPGTFNVVIDPQYWVAEGQMLRNGQLWGTVQFDGPVVKDTHGPDLVLHLTTGEDILLHKLIDYPPTGVEMMSAVPPSFSLHQNFPNPFNPTTTIQVDLSRAAFVTLKVYDVLGRDVATLVNEMKNAGRYEILFDGLKLTSGVYFYQLRGDQGVATKRMLLLK